MLNPVKFTVTLESGPVETFTAGSDYIAYEAHFNRPWIPDMATGSYTAQLFVVWHSLKRQGLTELDFEAFADTTPMFDSVKDEDVDPVVPLESSQPTG